MKLNRDHVKIHPNLPLRTRVRRGLLLASTVAALFMSAHVNAQSADVNITAPYSQAGNYFNSFYGSHESNASIGQYYSAGRLGTTVLNPIPASALSTFSAQNVHVSADPNGPLVTQMAENMIHLTGGSHRQRAMAMIDQIFVRTMGSVPQPRSADIGSRYGAEASRVWDRSDSTHSRVVKQKLAATAAVREVFASPEVQARTAEAINEIRQRAITTIQREPTAGEIAAFLDATMSRSGGDVAAQDHFNHIANVEAHQRAEQQRIHQENLNAEITRPQTFQADFYRQMNPDLAWMNHEQLRAHFLAHGVNEGRRASPSFYVRDYLDTYPDLRAAFGNNYDAATRHFLRNGINEGRWGAADFFVQSSVFVPGYYRMIYPDLAGMDDHALRTHWLSYGQLEGRTGNPLFNAFSYMALNPDVARAMNNDPRLATAHYIQYGTHENRRGNDFNAPAMQSYLRGMRDLAQGTTSYPANGFGGRTAPEFAYLNGYAQDINARNPTFVSDKRTSGPHVIVLNIFKPGSPPVMVIQTPRPIGYAEQLQDKLPGNMLAIAVFQN